MTGRIAHSTELDIGSRHPMRARRPLGPDHLESGLPGSVRADALFFDSNPMTGTAGDDFMFGLFNGPHHTINADAGDDFAIGDMSPFTDASGATNNGSIGAALDMETPAIWTVDENPLFGDFSIPHAMAYVTATAGEEEFYSVSIGAGQTITIDVDYGDSPIGVAVDTRVQLLDSVGNVLASSNNAGVGLGGFGSTSSLDAFLSFTVAAAGTYYIRAYQAGALTFAGGEEFLLNLSVTGHAVTTPTEMGNDTIDGGDNDDELFGAGGSDLIGGGAGDDLVHGGGGDDYVGGNDDDDTLFGGDGNDTLVGDEGDDTMFGGDGDDFMQDFTGVNVFDGGLGDDSMTGSGTFVFSGSGSVAENDTVSGNLGEATLSFAGSEVGVLLAFGTSTVVQNMRTVKFSGDTTIIGSDFDDTFQAIFDLDGGAGSDTLDFSPELESFDGLTLFWDLQAGLSTQGYDGPYLFTFASLENFIAILGVNDFVRGGAAANLLDGRNLDDALEGQGGNDTLIGGAGADALDGGAGIDTASYATAPGVEADLDDTASNTGHAAGDRYASIENLTGSIVFDRLGGNDAANVIDGGEGGDTLEGDAGADTLIGGVGADRLDGGGGTDTASHAGAAKGVRADLQSPNGNTGDAKGDSYVSIENLEGSGFNDLLRGDALANAIRGGARNDNLQGRDGADTLVGGTGKDTLNGGADADRFTLEFASKAHRDAITDFAPGDEIALLGSAFGQPVGAFLPNRFTLGATAGDANDRLIYDQASGRLWFDSDGTGAAKQVLIATLSNNAALAASDFVVI